MLAHGGDQGHVQGGPFGGPCEQGAKVGADEAGSGDAKGMRGGRGGESRGGQARRQGQWLHYHYLFASCLQVD